MSEEKEPLANLRLTGQALNSLIGVLDVARIHGNRAQARFALDLIETIEKGPTNEQDKTIEKEVKVEDTEEVESK